MENMDILELIRLYELSEIDEDDLTEKQIDKMIAYYKHETFELNDDTLLRTENIKTMIMDLSIKEISSDICKKLEELGDVLIESNEVELQKRAYFLLHSATDYVVCYHEIIVLWSLPEVIRYIIGEYSATVHEEVLNFSLNQLLEGQIYETDHRIGTVKTKWHIRLIHNGNLPSLFRLLKTIVVDDKSSLSELFDNADTKEEIEDLIDYYNECQDNVW